MKGTNGVPRRRRATIGTLSPTLEVIMVEDGAMTLLKGHREPLHISAPERRKLLALLKEEERDAGRVED